jgi:pimeloyl-ACP methyl ester carboxylesterase
MKRLRKHGKPPMNTAVIHGGPGAPGEMAPVARELASVGGVLEPFQTESTVEGQIRELKEVLEEEGDLPMILIGWSWGAWLSFLFASRYSASVKKMILIGSGPFEEKYARNIMQTRMNRIGPKEKSEALLLMKILDDAAASGKNEALLRFGDIFSKADSYDPIPQKKVILECRYDVYRNVWNQAARMRRTGKLLSMGKNIRCPVVAVHGDYDPHPGEGVKKPLSRILDDFRFILLDKCGHRPWTEKQAKDRFFDILKRETRG